MWKHAYIPEDRVPLAWLLNNPLNVWFSWCLKYCPETQEWKDLFWGKEGSTCGSQGCSSDFQRWDPVPWPEHGPVGPAGYGMRCGVWDVVRDVGWDVVQIQAVAGCGMQCGMRDVVQDVVRDAA